MGALFAEISREQDREAAGDAELEALATRAERSRYLQWIKPAIERVFAALLCVALLPSVRPGLTGRIPT